MEKILMNQNFMKEKPILPLVLSMALPMTISMLVNSLYIITLLTVSLLLKSVKMP